MQQLLIHLIPVYMALYAFVSVVANTQLAKPYKVALAIVLMLSSQYAGLSRAFYYGYENLLPHWAIVVFAWMFIAQAFLIIFCLAKDGYRLILWLKKKPSSLPSWTTYTVLISAAVMASLTLFTALRQPSIHHYEMAFKNLPAAFDGLRIAQISDTHASSLINHSMIEKMVQRTNEQKPDLIVITGDIVDGTVRDRHQEVRPLGKLHAKYGVYVIEGNHEHYVDYSNWIDFYQQIGLHLLSNQHVFLSTNHQKIALVGITDPMATRYDRVLPNLQKALEGIDPSTFTILLSHQVKHSRDYAQLPIDLQLSGHTHGGQIFGLHWLAQSLNRGFVRGTYNIDQTTLFVHSGSYLWFGFPIRFLIPGEIAMITLKRAPN